MKAAWDEVTTALGAPKARSSHAIAVIGRTLYVFGGEFEPRVPIDSTIFSFDLDSKCWSAVSASGDVPAPRIGVTMVALGSTLYVFGGRDSEHTELSDLFSFDTLKGSWTLLSSGVASPPARSYHAMVADDQSKSIFVFGGCGSNGRLNDLWSFQETAAKWQQMPSPPEGYSLVPRGGPGLAAADGAVWVLFGFCGHEMADVHRFELSTQSWSEVHPSSSDAVWPSARSVFGTAALLGSSPGGLDSILIFGGEIDPSDKGHEGAGQFSDQIFLLETKSKTWTRVEASGKGPGRRGWFPAAAFDGGMVVYGGNSESNDRLDDMFILKVA